MPVAVLCLTVRNLLNEVCHRFSGFYRNGLQQAVRSVKRLNCHVLTVFRHFHHSPLRHQPVARGFQVEDWQAKSSRLFSHIYRYNRPEPCTKDHRRHLGQSIL